MAKFRLGSREFRSKSAALAEFRRILNSQPIGLPLTGDDDALVRLLLEVGYHPEANEKIGSGIAHIVVLPSGLHGTNCFWIRRVDGTTADFSYIVAVNGGVPPASYVKAALRWEIDEQIAEYRSEQAPLISRGLVVCGLCGGPLAGGGVHVDHYEPTFDELAEKFASVTGGWESLRVECVGATGRQLADRELGVVWQEFHRRTARLRATHEGCNLRRTGANAHP